MNCRRARDLLTAGRATGGAARRHVESCADCERFARRLVAVETALGSHHAGLRPPAGFAAGVRARLPSGDGLIGWAALRLLPATLVLVLLLSWLNLRQEESVAAASEDPIAAVVGWVLDPTTEIGNGS
ncbi:MAG: hypothetical protein OES32_10465 [Acidobacteriota bacterium]|nr:hypothetical protein [Acidobacteriota bacterium]MDH3523998.1 hypothetical protein [Acidobacteriota bacterium]